MMALEREEPITRTEDPFLVQLLRNAETVYNWHDALNGNSWALQVPPRACSMMSILLAISFAGIPPAGSHLTWSTTLIAYVYRSLATESWLWCAATSERALVVQWHWLR